MSIPCIVLGAGLAGLMAANKLQQSGLDCLVLEAQRQPGGRMISWSLEDKRWQGAIYDIGAQFFTVREPRFARQVEHWIELGLVVEWSRGFVTADGSYYVDGHPRYRGVPDMGAIAQYLANNLDIRFNNPISAVKFSSPGWQVRDIQGNIFRSQALIMTPPVPQSLALLDAGGVRLSTTARKMLERIFYEPCLALCVQLGNKGNVPEPGGLWHIGEPIAWIADNHRKGVSKVPGSITIHAGNDFSRDYWSASDEKVTGKLLSAAGEWLGNQVKNTYVHRWPYSKPLWLHSEAIFVDSEHSSLVFAGDAFAGPRVEGAALSGLAAADYLLNGW